MIVKEINSPDELQSHLKKNDKSYLLIYKKGSEQSDCAYSNYLDATKEIKNIGLYSVDVNEVKNVHTLFNVTSAPTLVEFSGYRAGKVFKGCQEPGFFKAIFEDAVYFSENKEKGISQKNVVVYSTPTCSWCTTLKSYLRQHKIRFRDVDVSRDQSAAEAMVRKSGQQGVPQTDINGSIVVGFDKKRINELLEIKG